MILWMYSSKCEWIGGVCIGYVKWWFENSSIWDSTDYSGLMQGDGTRDRNGMLRMICKGLYTWQN